MNWRITMLNPIKEISKWQKDAGNADRPYDDFLESSFQVEEALEGHNTLPNLCMQLNMSDEDSDAKAISREILSHANYNYQLSDVERLDKACDAIVYAIGSMTKLGLDHHGITKALNIVNKANVAKLGMPRDEAGKLLKPVDFKGPEPELEELLEKYGR